jgi:glutamate-5-semialdehyde dehydrogenase
MAQLTSAEKNAILLAMADAIAANEAGILAANQVDLEASGLTGAIRDRLLLTPERIAAMVAGVREVASLSDPIGETIAEWTRPNGLRIRKVRVPLGVVGVIYESRPNVTVDCASLVLKTGNAIVLRGGKEAVHSNQKLVEILSGLVDVVIPRGGPGLISFVADNATVPVIETGAGNCHIFVDASADFEMADGIVLNAKTQRPSVCNSAEKLLVHRDIAAQYVPRIVKKLLGGGVEVRGDDETRRLAAGMHVTLAEAQDWNEEYLRLCIAIRVIPDIEDAIAHINRYSTKNSEAIVTSDEGNANRFLRLVDSAVVYWNASTRFSDGGEFGFGAEMGISTQKLHCRGPFALAELTSAKYEVTGTGQIR